MGVGRVACSGPEALSSYKAGPEGDCSETEEGPGGTGKSQKEDCR